MSVMTLNAHLHYYCRYYNANTDDIVINIYMAYVQIIGHHIILYNTASFCWQVLHMLQIVVPADDTVYLPCSYYRPRYIDMCYYPVF